MLEKILKNTKMGINEVFLASGLSCVPNPNVMRTDKNPCSLNQVYNKEQDRCEYIFDEIPVEEYESN